MFLSMCSSAYITDNALHTVVSIIYVFHKACEDVSWAELE